MFAHSYLILCVRSFQLSSLFLLNRNFVCKLRSEKPFFVGYSNCQCRVWYAVVAIVVVAVAVASCCCFRCHCCCCCCCFCCCCCCCLFHRLEVVLLTFVHFISLIVCPCLCMCPLDLLIILLSVRMLICWMLICGFHSDWWNSFVMAWLMVCFSFTLFMCKWSILFFFRFHSNQIGWSLHQRLSIGSISGFVLSQMSSKQMRTQTSGRQPAGSRCS